MDIKITGKVIARGEVKKGSTNGKDWQGVDYTIEEIEGRYPKRMNFTVFGVEATNRVLPVLVKDTVATVEAEIDAREYNGRWFNSIRAFKIQVDGKEILHVQAQPSQPSQSAAPQQATPQQTSISTEDAFASTKDDSLPF